MNNSGQNKLSFSGYFWFAILILLLGVASAAKPGLAFAFAFVAVIMLAGHLYLRGPIDIDEDFDQVYPKRLAAFSILVFLFSPHLIWRLGDLGLVIQFGIPLAVLLFANYHALKSKNFRWRTHSVNIYLFAIVGSILVSMLFGFFMKGVMLSPRDILEIKAPIYFFLAFNLFYQLTWKPDEIKKYFLFPLIGGGLITVLIGFVQYLHLFDLNERFFSYWTEENHLRELTKPESRRIFSTFKASGIYGVFLLLLASHILAAIYSRFKVNYIIAFVTLFLTIVALFLTGTKSSLLLFFFLIVIFPFFFYADPRYKLLGSGVTLALMVLIIVTIFPLIDGSYMMERMKSVSQSASNVIQYGSSVRPEEYLDETSVGRFALWTLAAPRIEASPIFGHGPGKMFLRHEGFHRADGSEIKFESSYLQLIVRYGVLGLIVNLALFIYLMILQLRILRIEDCNIYLRRLASAHLVFFVLLLAAFLAGDFIFNIQLMSPLYASAGIGASFLLNQNKNNLPK